MSPRDPRVAFVVAAQQRRPRRILEQIEGGEVRQLDAVVVHERGFEPTIGGEELGAELRQNTAVLVHGLSLGVRTPCYGTHVSVEFNV